MEEEKPSLKWAWSFEDLLDNKDALNAFQEYVKSINQEILLTFHFACEGLKSKETDDGTAFTIIYLIYK